MSATSRGRGDALYVGAETAASAAPAKPERVKSGDRAAVKKSNKALG